MYKLFFKETEHKYRPTCITTFLRTEKKNQNKQKQKQKANQKTPLFFTNSTQAYIQ